MATYIAVVEAHRWEGDIFASANAILPVRAETDAEAEEIAASVVSPTYPEFEGWQRPLVVTVVEFGVFFAQKLWTAESARAVRIGK